MKGYFITLAILFSYMKVCSQVQIIDCDGYAISSSEGKERIIGFFERMAMPINGLEGFYHHINKTTSKSSEKGKVYIEFVVDTTGNVHCAKIIKSENELLNSRAIVLIENTKFIPAEQRGKKVVSIVILPITFGDLPEDEKK